MLPAKELEGKELRKWLRTATQKEINEYWRLYLAPKYGYKRLIEPKTGKVVMELD